MRYPVKLVAISVRIHCDVAYRLLYDPNFQSRISFDNSAQFKCLFHAQNGIAMVHKHTVQKIQHNTKRKISICNTTEFK